MSLDTFIVLEPCTNRWFAASEAYLVDARKLSDEEFSIVTGEVSYQRIELVRKHGMTLDSCEYHKIMECAEEVEETMKIDLEEFVGKEVIITLKNDEVIKTEIIKEGNEIYPYYCDGGSSEYKSYTRYGQYNICEPGPFDIVKIELKQPQKTMTPLSNDTIQKLADALTDDAIKYLETDEEVIETLVSVIGRFLTDRMGQMDENLLSEICLGIFENFDLVSNNK